MMEYMSEEQIIATETPNKILCCDCGTLIDPNPSNLCIGCLRSKVDITETIPKQLVLYFCKGCERYQQAVGQWVVAELESRELLALCLKKLKGLNRVNLIDATFIWTEPHSRRVKTKLTIQKEVNGGAILQQVFVVEFIVNLLMCDDCHRREAKDFWKAVVQVRQKASHKKTFLYLEQLLLKYKAHEKCINVKQIHDGIDFFYNRKDDARKLVDFLHTIVPCRYITSQQLISHDTHSNTYNYKYTFAVEIVPICKDDVVCLPLATARALGNIGQLCIVVRVTQQILLIDPFTLKTAELTASNYFRNPFRALCSAPHLIEYTVMDLDEINDAIPANSAVTSKISQKHVLADAYVVKSNEIGSGDPIHTRTHLGHLLHPGDLALGFDIRTANLNEPNFEKFEQSNNNKFPDVILVKKYFGDRISRNRKRQWKLKRLERTDDDDTAASTDGRDYYDFMEDLEEDPMLRQNINIYKDHQKIQNEMAIDSDDVDEDAPQITLQEMLEDLIIED